MAHLRGVMRCLAVLVSLLLWGMAEGASAVSADGPTPAVHILTGDDQMYRLAGEGGYERVVQVFPWRDIEPTAGEWHWQQPDFAVQAAGYYGLDLVVRLDHPPNWGLRQTEGREPPIDLEAYATYVRAIAQRYRGKVQAYIIWNEPNLSREWAGQPPDAAGYTALLCRAYGAIKVVDPGAMVVSAGLAPTNGGDGALDDRLFLQAMYEVGAGACFDVLGAHAYGFGHPPEDPRGAHDGLNMARLEDLRDIMDANGETAPVWITEFGWTTDGKGDDAWQTVSAGEQAYYLLRAWRRIGREWPWVQMATVWNLSQGAVEGDEMAGYSLLAADGSPKPAYSVMRSLLGSDVRRAMRRLIERSTDVREAASGAAQVLAADEIVHLGDDQ